MKLTTTQRLSADRKLRNLVTLLAQRAVCEGCGAEEGTAFHVIDMYIMFAESQHTSESLKEKAHVSLATLLARSPDLLVIARGLSAVPPILETNSLAAPMILAWGYNALREMTPLFLPDGQSF